VLGPTLGKGRHKTQQEQDITILRTAKDVRGVRGQGQGDEGTRGRTQDSGGRSHQAEMGMAMPTTLTVHCENILNKIRKVS